MPDKKKKAGESAKQRRSNKQSKCRIKQEKTYRDTNKRRGETHKKRLGRQQKKKGEQ